ncbi:hypothetical protein [Methylobacterium sp. Leaf118]|uniref:hypothetical protein n=1 Tax=Methylobacterium sp. Leaf118 TaxID=2876562 RepID=UPI001E5FF1EA|nr:hypothetical protein [Methylobacterium sp. Leaf118]
MTNFRTTATVWKNNTEEVRLCVINGAVYQLVDMQVFLTIGRRHEEFSQAIADKIKAAYGRNTAGWDGLS